MNRQVENGSHTSAAAHLAVMLHGRARRHRAHTQPGGEILWRNGGLTARHRSRHLRAGLSLGSIVLLPGKI